MVASHPEGQPAEWVGGDPPQAADAVGVALGEVGGGEVTHWSKMDPSTQWGFWEEEVGRVVGEMKEEEKEEQWKMEEV